MKPTTCLTFCLLLLAGFRDGVKVAFSNVLHFDAGVLYEYEYSTSMTLAPISVDLGDVTTTSLEAVIQIHSLWRNPQDQEEQLLHVKIKDLKFTTDSSDATTKPLAVEELDGGLDYKEAVIVHMNSGKIQGVFDTTEDNTASLNFKKGLVSLLQIQSTYGLITEDDATGRCQVLYHTLKDDIIKVKNYKNCENSITDDVMSSAQILGVSSPGWSEAVFIMDDNHIKSVTSQEFRSVVLEEQSTVGIHVSSRQLLRLLSTKSGANEEAQGELQEVLASFKGSHVNHTIHALPAVRQSALSGYPISKLLDHLKANEMKKSQSRTTEVFLQLSQSLRSMKMNEIKDILKKSDSTLVSVLIDAAAAASTPAALDAVISYIDVADPKKAPLLEKFLYACAFSAQPSPHLISVVNKILSHTSTKRQTREIARIVLGTVIRKMCSANMCLLQEVEDALTLILKGLGSSKDEAEIKSHLLALKSALIPEIVPVLLQYIDQSKPVSIIVLSALQDLPTQYITEEVKQHVRDIFKQNKKSFSAAVRVAAAQILLMHDPLYTDVKEVLLRIAKEKPEISKFLTAKVTSLLQSNHPARDVILTVLKDSKLNNYFHLGRVGCSSSYAGLMAEAKDTVTSYEFEFLFSDTGALKQSNSHFSTQSRGGSLHSLQVSLELGGIDSLLASEPIEEAEQEDLMAGMSAMFLGVQIQPITFFQGYTDLMSKYFTAPDGPMNILSGNILLINQKQSVILQSGLQTQVFFHGGLSVDVSADLDFSLFTQESKSTVNNGFSIVVSARAEAEAPFMSTTVKTKTEMNSSISFVTTVNFSTIPVQYCLQLIREPLLYREKTSTRVSIQNRKKTAHQKRRKWTIPGEETALHRDNSMMCRKLL
ncbi:microsomal triglyceride transfer protein large subunit-like isoform X1 [Astyanax mexicanus]|uniref:Microsomal triglyceride transfer protein large subunit-like isoform X1 n=2 Tax=Astyanax mexicanus TaxID=7994 RepID=A0A8T2M2Z0_ASTMX|nr:microsomal triglyceride transfer protein large subunit-like isoform X1 [Astyanax mexicanus]